MIVSEPTWAFVIRQSDGSAVMRGAELCWYGTGQTRAEARASVLTRASARSGLAVEELIVTGFSAENYAAHMADARERGDQ